MAAGIQIFKKTQIDTGRVERRDFVFDRVGYKLFQNILATLYVVYIGLLLFISYEMHLVELRCSKSASLW